MCQKKEYRKINKKQKQRKKKCGKMTGSDFGKKTNRARGRTCSRASNRAAKKDSSKKPLRTVSFVPDPFWSCLLQKNLSVARRMCENKEVHTPRRCHEKKGDPTRGGAPFGRKKGLFEKGNVAPGGKLSRPTSKRGGSHLPARPNRALRKKKRRGQTLATAPTQTGGKKNRHARAYRKKTQEKG
nr:hypothetical protein [Pandoravirus massiliensis]